MCISSTALLDQVFSGLSFPARRWELVAQAEQFGVDADTHDQLTRMPVAHYLDCEHVAVTLAGHGGRDGAPVAGQVAPRARRALSAQPAHRQPRREAART